LFQDPLIHYQETIRSYEDVSVSRPGSKIINPWYSYAISVLDPNGIRVIFNYSAPVPNNIFAHNFTAPNGFFLASFPHTVNKPVGEIFNLSKIPDDKKFLAKNVYDVWRWYSENAPDPLFGNNISWFEGIQMDLTTPSSSINGSINVSYDTLEFRANKAVELKPGNRWIFFGYPFTRTMRLSDVYVQQLDASGKPVDVLLSFADAYDVSWVDDPILFFNETGPSWGCTSTRTSYNCTRILEPWRGYQIYVYPQYGVRLYFNINAPAS